MKENVIRHAGTNFTVTSDRRGNDVLTDAAITEKYQHDWSADAPGMPSAVVRPATTEALAETLKLCHGNDQAVVVQGGLTGLYWRRYSQAGEIAINLSGSMALKNWMQIQ